MSSARTNEIRSLYCQALAAMQATDESQPFSYFQIAGNFFLLKVKNRFLMAWQVSMEDHTCHGGTSIKGSTLPIQVTVLMVASTPSLT